MAQESCNLDKDDAELLKPSSSASATSAAPPPPAAAPSSAMFHISTSSQEQHHQLQQQQQQQLVPRTDAPKKPNPPTNSSSSSFTRKRKLESPPPPEPDASSPVASAGCDVKAQKTESTPDAPAAARTVNRCSCCQKRVGLTGFRCRCGDLFCAAHRYSDAHGCSFDYKAAGRAEISKANPVVRAPKIIKI